MFQSTDGRRTEEEEKISEKIGTRCDLQASIPLSTLERSRVVRTRVTTTSGQLEQVKGFEKKHSSARRPATYLQGRKSHKLPARRSTGHCSLVRSLDITLWSSKWVITSVWHFFDFVITFSSSQVFEHFQNQRPPGLVGFLIIFHRKVTAGFRLWKNFKVSVASYELKRTSGSGY